LVVWLAQIVALIIFSALKIVINPKTLIISFISLLIGLYLLYTIQFFDSTSINSNYQIPSAILTSLNFIWMGLLFFWLCFLLSSPLWTLLISWTTAFKLLKHYESKLTLQRGLSIALWLSGFAAAWRVVVLSTLEVYSRLPTTPPECYIATAAAYGHPRFVGSREIIFTNGKSMRVNAQLQNLKCAELVLKSTSPRLHGILRKVYDVVGRKLAVKITNPFLSDIAYLLLKPFEWFAVFIFEIFLSEAKIIAKEFYTR